MTVSATPRPRTPLDLERLLAALDDAGWNGPPPSVVASTGSTNADLAVAAAAGAAQWTALATDEQVAGRGRLDRRWTAPARSGVLVSVLLRPGGDVEPGSWGWLPLIAGVAVTDALAGLLPGAASLKWPNDVVVDGPDRAGGPGPRKLAGLLVERVAGDAVVVGIGLNVDLTAEECPVPTATSLLLEGCDDVDRHRLLAGVLTSLHRRFGTWRDSGGDAERSGLAAAYRRRCLTLGRPVAAALPSGETVEGMAEEVLPDGSLAILTATGRVVVAAGDVVHLR